MKDTIALGFIVALIGITSAVATAQDHSAVVTATTVSQSSVDNSLEPAGMYALLNAEDQGY